ncbi:kinase-like domain-containing protein [Rhizophagus clarus]|uniref:Kinase-like domain-containing protein n=1 Tax=Rhizophagus clarus TaxID=94130 RepID=A0A8H3L9P3_9GLOM|nr:kinase-like domain-containing protein [Rhizophagus clarus]
MSLHPYKINYFKQDFKNWTSGNNLIDKFIQDSQLSATNIREALEWIPYSRFVGIKYIAKGGFGKVYEAEWIDGPMYSTWNQTNQRWDRKNLYKNVALKSINNSKNITSEFINEIASHHKITKAEENSKQVIKFYGVTQDPKTKDYMMVLKYAGFGSLRSYLDKYYYRLNLLDKIGNLQRIADGIYYIHQNELIHRDLHTGNILKDLTDTFIADVGLCRPADYNVLEDTNKKIYGVLPYIAPEILRGQNYTKASDIYSFGIIMYEVISGLPPYHDVIHKKPLACLDANPSNRPTANEIATIFDQWWFVECNEYRKNSSYETELIRQIKEVEEINNSLTTDSLTSTSLALSYETHPEAIYTSRLLDFNDLPEPKNSDDYYEQYDNISSMKYSESLQIDITKLKLNDSDEMEDVRE